MTPRAREWTAALAAVAVTATTAGLGFWQLDRAAQKTALQAAIVERGGRPPLAAAELAPVGADAAVVAAQRHRHAAVDGRWLADRTVYLDNRQMDGRVGFFVVTPLLLADGSAVAVQRGFVARDNDDRARIALPPPPRGDVRVHGHVVDAPSRLFEFGAAASGPIRQNLDLADSAREWQLALRPLAIVEHDGPANAGDGLQRRWPRPDSGVAKHHGYAFQWFALSALTVIFYAWFRIVRPRRRVAR